MKTAVICFSDAGAALAGRIRGELGLDPRDIHSTAKFADRYGFAAHEKISADMAELFAGYDALIFVGACGIAVRSIAPHLKSKAEDPAVLVLDDGGRFVIPILSGHIGGANDLARMLAEKLGAVPVVTTATDGSGRFSCDAWAVTHGCAISSLAAAKAVSAAILTEDVPIASEFPLPAQLPAGLVPGKTGAVGVKIGIGTEEPFGVTLRLVPKIAVLGIGCRRGSEEETIRKAVTETFAEHGIDPASVCLVASVDLKRDEEGLLSFADGIGVPAAFYPAEELAEVPGEFAESAFVKKTVGVGNVCERAAVLAAEGGRLIVPKTAKNGVTVAAAVREWRIAF